MILMGENGSTGEGGGNLSQNHFIHHRPHMDWPGIEPVTPLGEAGG
jgi:hypothetical protein